MIILPNHTCCIYGLTKSDVLIQKKKSYKLTTITTKYCDKFTLFAYSKIIGPKDGRQLLVENVFQLAPQTIQKSLLFF